jgi:hypothetical protein
MLYQLCIIIYQLDQEAVIGAIAFDYRTLGINCDCCCITEGVGGCRAPAIRYAQGVLHCLPSTSRYHRSQCARLIRLGAAVVLFTMRFHIGIDAG